MSLKIVQYKTIKYKYNFFNYILVIYILNVEVYEEVQISYVDNQRKSIEQ